MSLKWEGDKVIKKMEACIMTGINQTMSAASVHAKRNHPWVNRTGTLEGSIRPAVKAQKKGNEFIGVWGSVGVDYALYLELGLGFNLVQGAASFGKGTRSYAFLRPAAEVEYPKLAGRIAKLYDRKIIGPLVANLETGII